ESVLVFENLATENAGRKQPGNLDIRPVRRTLQQTGYPLGVIVMPGQELLLKLVHDARRFETDTVSRMLSHLRVVLTEMAMHPERRLAEVSLLSPAERPQMLVGWNQTATDYPRGRCVHELVEAQAARTPDAAAIDFQGRTLTYAQLDRRANQLAHHLRR